MEGLVLPALPWVPPDDRETRMVEGVQPVAPMQVSRTKMSLTPFVSPLTRLSASEPKATKRPLLLMAGLLPALLPCVPLVATETRIVEGVQPPPAPAQVSRTKTSGAPFVSPATRLLASERKATKRPSELMAGSELVELPSAPPVEIETRRVLRAQPSSPRQVSRQKTSVTPLPSLATRLLASEGK